MRHSLKYSRRPDMQLNPARMRHSIEDMSAAYLLNKDIFIMPDLQDTQKHPFIKL
jgi:hypothetical protein